VRECKPLPNGVCTEMGALGCVGEDAASKKAVLWRLARDKAIAHNAYVKGISIGQCATSPSDQKLGRHQFSAGPDCLLIVH